MAKSSTTCSTTACRARLMGSRWDASPMQPRPNTTSHELSRTPSRPNPHDADLYEINEAFAAVTMVAMREVDIDHARVNVNGGACALGHPIGATGARILTTLIHGLHRRGGKRGIASLCIGGGEAVALAVEVPPQ